MKFKNIKDAGEGTLGFDVEASKDEVTWLVNFAVENLMKEGIITLNQYADEQDVTLREVAH